MRLKMGTFVFFMVCNLAWAGFSVGDDFNDGTVDTGLWNTNFLNSDGVLLAETNGRLEFSSPGPGDGEDRSIAWAWAGNSGSYTQNWTLTCTVVGGVDPTSFSDNEYWLGFAVTDDPASLEDVFSVELNAESRDVPLFNFFCEGSVGGGTRMEFSNPVATNTVSLRIVFDAFSRTLTGSYSLGNGYINPVSLQIDDWSMTESNTFTAALYAGNVGVVIAPGQVYFDDFALSPGATGLDSDGDGLPNDFEEQFFGGITNAVASDDSDHDGQDNATEYIVGTNPTVPNAPFSITNFTMSVADGAVLEWAPVAGRVYSVYGSTNPATGFRLVERDIPATVSSATDQVFSASGSAFYSIGVGLYPPLCGLDLALPKKPDVDRTSSHATQVSDLHIDRQGIRTVHPGNFVHAVAYADFNGDGLTDVFMASGDASSNATPAELYVNDGEGGFTLDQSLFGGTVPSMVHPRKAVVGDYNGDGKMDVFVAGHGYDVPPYPGEVPYVLLSSTNGTYATTVFSDLNGFHHAAASADIDADGDLDIYLADSDVPCFLINDGSGNFTPVIDRLVGFGGSSFFTAELVDVDQDGFVDLLCGGHEHEGFATRIVWGDRTGVYKLQESTVLPAIDGEGVVLDVDVADLDGDGDRDLVINRTGDGTGSLSFYQGYRIQMLENTGDRQFIDVSAARITAGSNASGNWFDWIVLKDTNGDHAIDIVVDDAARGMIWRNNGSGSFALE